MSWHWAALGALVFVLLPAGTIILFARYVDAKCAELARETSAPRPADGDLNPVDSALMHLLNTSCLLRAVVLVYPLRALAIDLKRPGFHTTLLACLVLLPVNLLVTVAIGFMVPSVLYALDRHGRRIEDPRVRAKVRQFVSRWYFVLAPLALVRRKGLGEVLDRTCREGQ